MRLVFISIFGLLLNACATPQAPITNKSHELAARLQQQNQSLKYWDLSGRASLVTDNSAYYFDVQWQQNNEKYQLRLDGPLGSGSLRLKGHTGFAELTFDNKVVRGTKPEDLITQLTPFNIPVTGLKSWVVGVPHKKSTYKQTINAKGQIQTLQQDGWLITFNEWEKVTLKQQAYQLPSDINLSQQDLKIRIRPSQWHSKTQPKTNPIFNDLAL